MVMTIPLFAEFEIPLDIFIVACTYLYLHNDDPDIKYMVSSVHDIVCIIM